MSALAYLITFVGGAAIAFLGRKLLWLLCAMAGYIVGFQLVQLLFPSQDNALALVLAVAAGLVLGYLGLRAMGFVLRLAAFLILGSLGLGVAGWLGLSGLLWSLIFFVAAGLIGLALLRFVAVLGVILVTAVGGAYMVTYGLAGLMQTPQPGTLASIIGLVVLVAGFIWQWRNKPAD